MSTRAPAPTGIQKGVIDCDGQSGLERRSFMKAGAMGFMGLSLVNLLRSTVLAGPSHRRFQPRRSG